jgi:hypothetical protein
MQSGGASRGNFALEREAGFRFHDLRHQGITELSEGGSSDVTIMRIAPRIEKNAEHYSQTRSKTETPLLSLITQFANSLKTATL